jgi:hypothetical protein
LKIEKIVFTEITPEELPKVLESLSPRPKDSGISGIMNMVLAGMSMELVSELLKPKAEPKTNAGKFSKEAHKAFETKAK